jgi:hypothetical protein
LLAVTSVAELVEIRNLKSKTPYTAADEPLINRAIDILSTEYKIPRDQVTRGKFPVVVQINEVHCVEFKIKQNWLGEPSIVCFDPHLNRIRNVEFK